MSSTHGVIVVLGNQRIHKNIEKIDTEQNRTTDSTPNSIMTAYIAVQTSRIGTAIIHDCACMQHNNSAVP